MKIAFFDIENWERESFKDIQQDHEVRYFASTIQDTDFEEFQSAEVVSVFIYSQVSRELMEKMPNLRLVTTRSTGFDHVDTDYCQEKGIKVCNVPTYGSNTVAEHVFGLLLTINHNLVEAVERTRRADFSLAGLQGYDLYGKTMGAIGVGDIGSNVVRIAHGFGMNTLAYDLKPNPELTEKYNCEFVSLDEVLERSDVISIHVPSSPSTRHLLAAEQFKKMKEGVVIINTARGEVISVKDLLHALADGKVRAVGLDVLPEEPAIREEAELLRYVFREEHDLSTLLADHVLLRMKNVYITPHSAFNTKEAVLRILTTTRENIEAYIRGEEKNVVEPKK